LETGRKVEDIIRSKKNIIADSKEVKTILNQAEFIKKAIAQKGTFCQ
jgi:hypothetical protein